MSQPEDNINYPFWYYQHEPRETLILDEFADIMIKNKKITGWAFIVDKQLSKFNLGTSEEPCITLINVVLPEQF